MNPMNISLRYLHDYLLFETNGNRGKLGRNVLDIIYGEQKDSHRLTERSTEGLYPICLSSMHARNGAFAWVCIIICI